MEETECLDKLIKEKEDKINEMTKTQNEIKATKDAKIKQLEEKMTQLKLQKVDMMTICKKHIQLQIIIKTIKAIIKLMAKCQQI